MEQIRIESIWAFFSEHRRSCHLSLSTQNLNPFSLGRLYNLSPPPQNHHVHPLSTTRIHNSPRKRVSRRRTPETGPGTDPPGVSAVQLEMPRASGVRPGTPSAVKGRGRAEAPEPRRTANGGRHRLVWWGEEVAWRSSVRLVGEAGQH